MTFSLKQLLDERTMKEMAVPSTTQKQRYRVTLRYEKHPNGKPIYTRICYVRIEGMNCTYLKEEEVRPFSRRDRITADESYWDKPLFKVFYRKLLNDVPKQSVFYFEETVDLEAWEHACKKLGIVNAFVLRLHSQ